MLFFDFETSGLRDCETPMSLILKSNRDLRQEVVFLIVFGRDPAAILVGERNVDEDLARDLGLQFGGAHDDVIMEIEHRRLIESSMQQSEVFGQSLLDFRTNRDAVVIVEKVCLVGEVGPIVHESRADGVVAEPRNGVDAVFHSNESTQPEVVTLVFVGQHLTGQKRRVLIKLEQIHLYAAVDFEVGLLPLLFGGIPVDEGAVEQLVVGIESNQTIVAFDGAIVAEVAVVDVACIERGTKAKIIMPFVLRLGTDHTENQQHKK